MNEYTYEWKADDGMRLAGRGWATDDPARGVICLVHGLGEHAGRYAHMAAYFTARGFSVHGFDLRGHGKSGGKRGHAASYQAIYGDIDHLVADARERYPGLSCFLYGHSLGGNLAINYTLARRPALNGVVVTGPGLRTAFTPPAWKILLGKAMKNLAPELVMPSGLDANGLARDPRVKEAYLRDPLVHDRVSARLGMDLLTMGEAALGQAADFSLPLLLMHGGADPLTSPEASRQFAASAGERCTLKIWDGLLHEIHNEPEQEQVFAFTLQWLEARLNQVSV
ncbi:MAG: lysophospholipase [Chloroflexi bacterium]|nr:lysophospholipase [Chloroflexota bacterium]